MDTIQLIWHLLSVVQGVETQLTAVGFQHTVAVMADGRTMAWGHTARGRLGVGTLERKGVPPPNNHNFPIPTVVPAFAQRKVKQVPIVAEVPSAAAAVVVVTLTWRCFVGLWVLVGADCVRRAAQHCHC